MDFFTKVQMFTGEFSKNVLIMLRMNKFSSLMAFKKPMDQDDFEKLYLLMEEKVKKLTSTEIKSYGLEYEGDLKNFSLSMSEKNEICGIFNVLKVITVNDFKNVTSCDDISTTVANLLAKLRQDNSILDDVRHLLTSPKSKKKFNFLIKRCELRYQESSTGNRYYEELLKFCTLMYVKAGRKAYNTLEMNSTLPSEETCKANIKEKYGEFLIGKVYAKQCREHLERHNLSKTVCVSEDATRLKAYVRYDSRQQELIGIVVSNSSNGLPDHTKLKVKTPRDVMYLMKNFPRANFVEVIMAKSISGGPAFVLAVFPTNNGFTSIDVENRWKSISEELGKEGIEVIGFSTNGAPCLLTGMKLLLGYGNVVFDNALGIKLLFDVDGPYGCIQDVIHLVNKLKIQLFDDDSNFWIGNFLASGKHLMQLVENQNFSKYEHGLVLSDVVHKDLTRDKMNFSSTEKICAWKVINLLKTFPGTQGTVEYLKNMRYLIEAYITPSTSGPERMKKALYVLNFFRTWRHNLDLSGKVGEKFFISKNCWESIEINTGFLIRLAKRGLINHIIHCNSQPCESFFRNLRSLSTSGLTKINFTMFDCIRDIEKLQLIEIYEHELKTFGFEFPTKNVVKSDSSSSLDSLIEEEVVDSDLWSSGMIFIVFNEANVELAEFLYFAKMTSCNEIDLAKFLHAPDRTKLLTNEMKKYTLENFSITEPELEDFILEDGTDLGTHVVFKNKKFLNENAVNHRFKLLLENGQHETFPISRFLWLIHEEVEKVSNDRLLRFQTNMRQEWRPTPLGSLEVAERSSISIGEIVMANTPLCKSTLLGIVLKFRVKPQENTRDGSKSKRKFLYSTLKFDENKDIEFLMYPCYMICADGKIVLHESWKDFLGKENYICTVNHDAVDFQNQEVSHALLQSIFRSYDE